MIAMIVRLVLFMAARQRVTIHTCYTHASAVCWAYRAARHGSCRLAAVGQAFKAALASIPSLPSDLVAAETLAHCENLVFLTGLPCRHKMS